MSSTPQTRLDLLIDLISIPSVTQSPEEDLASQFIYERLSSLAYFQENPHFLRRYPTPLERDSRPLHTVFARVMAPVPTPRTVVLVGHFDVVEVSMYGELRDLAFSPHELREALKRNTELLSHKACADLESGRFLFGRGSMDMKCGLVLGMELLRDFCENRNLFDVNLLLVAVPDEENSSAGMRGAVKELARLRDEEGLEFICALNTEPSEPGRPGAENQVVFTGTVGKISPVFLCVGQESHVGNYYCGLSAPLLAAQVVNLAEANPDLADPAGENTCPSWICLGLEILRESYSVTVPNRAVAYFNCFSVHKTPAQIMQEIKQIARQSITQCLEKIHASSRALLKMGYANGSAQNWEVPFLTVEELVKAAEERLGGADALREKVRRAVSESGKSDLRDLAIAALLEIHLQSGLSGPMIVGGFLPPYYPARNNQITEPTFEAVNKAVAAVISQAGKEHGIILEECPLFAGICDLSYMGFQGKPDELASFQRNLADQGALYEFPARELTRLDVPIVNLGPCGYDAHKLGERLELDYSLNVLPKLIKFFIGKLAQNA